MPKSSQETSEQSFARIFLNHWYHTNPEEQQKINQQLDRINGERKKCRKTLTRPATTSDRIITEYQAGSTD